MRPSSFIIAFLCSFIGLPFVGLAQLAGDSTKTIEVLHADSWHMLRRTQKGNMQLLKGRVRAKHENTLFFCDSAYLYGANKDIEAFGNVLIEFNDSVRIYADYLKYNAASRQAHLQNHIVLHDNKKRLYTDHMIYDRNLAKANYWKWGKLVDSTNILRSQKGYYYSRIKLAEFKDDVEVETPEYTMQSDTLRYFTRAKEVRFAGPTTITGDSTYAYAEEGYYNQRNKDLILQMKADIHRKQQQIRGDSLYMNNSLGLAEGQGHIVLIDTAQKMEVYGQQLYYNKLKRIAWVTDSACAQRSGEQDTLYMHADTLAVFFDAQEKVERLEAYKGMRFYSHDIQGMSDSLCYHLRDSILKLYKAVYLWNKENQISCDSADVYMTNKQIDSAVFYDNVFVASQDTIDPQYFNQMRSQRMWVWFRQNEIRKLRLLGQVKTNYFVWEEDQTPVGMFYIQSESLNIWMKDRKIQEATYYTKPENTTFPLDQLPPEKASLPGFQWKVKWRPFCKEDIFKTPLSD